MPVGTSFRKFRNKKLDISRNLGCFEISMLCVNFLMDRNIPYIDIKLGITNDIPKIQFKSRDINFL